MSGFCGGCGRLVRSHTATSPGRRSSVCIQTKSGPGRATVSASVGPYSVRSKASSLSAPTVSQVSAIAFARVTTESHVSHDALCVPVFTTPGPGASFVGEGS